MNSTQQELRNRAALRAEIAALTTQYEAGGGLITQLPGVGEYKCKQEPKATTERINARSFKINQEKAEGRKRRRRSRTQ